MRKLEILFMDKGSLVKFTKMSQTPKNAAIAILRYKMRDDGHTKFDSEEIFRYIKGWNEHLDEIEGQETDIQTVIDHMADMLVYASGVHIIGSGKTEVSNDFKSETCTQLERILFQTVEKHGASLTDEA